MINNNQYAKKYDLDEYTGRETWVRRIIEQLNEHDMTQKSLSDKTGIPTQTISGWLKVSRKRSGEKSLGAPPAPQISSLQLVAKAFNVTLDYLMGGQECTTPEDSQINEITKLSQSALSNLKQVRKHIDEIGSISAEKKIAMVNYLLENIEESSFFENLYDYVFCGLAIRDGANETLGAVKTISISPSGKTENGLYIGSVISNACLSLVLKDLTLIKDNQERKGADYMGKYGKADYLEWEREHEGDLMQMLDALYENDAGVDDK